MTDRACDRETEEEILNLIITHHHVLGVDKLSTACSAIKFMSMPK